MLAQLISLLTVATIAMAAYGLGCPILRGLGVGRQDRLSSGVWSVAVGLISAGTLLAVLGLFGALYTSLIGVLTVVACFWGIGELVRGYLDGWEARAWSQSGRSDDCRAVPWAPPAGWLSRGILLLAVLACLGSLAGALAPPTAGDALCYHLELPKAFLAEHTIHYLPYSENSTFPLLVEMWYLWGLALDGAVTAGLIHWGLGVLVGLATVVLATPIVGRSWAWVAGAVVVLVPGVNNQMTAPLNDLGLALFGTLALAAWHRAVTDDDGRRWFVLAGLAAGGALATKYLALIFAAAMAIPCVWVFLRRPQRRRLVIEGIAVVAVVSVSVGGLWYLRAGWHRGNPVYPFLTEVFDAADPVAAGAHETLPESKSPLGRKPLGPATAAWHVTMQPERFGGRGHQLGVLFLAAVPGVLFARRLRGLGTLLAVALAYWIIWYLLRQNVRFLLPIVPALSVAVIWVWIEIRRFPVLPRLVAGIAMAGVLAAFAVAALVRCDDQWAAALGLESHEEYLTRCEPTWAAADVSNRIFGPEAHLLSQDYRAFYFQCRVTRENVYRRHVPYDRAIADPSDFSRVLREAGFTHLLLAENVADRGIQYDSTLSRLADAQWAAGDTRALVKLADYRFEDSDGAVRRYRLVLLR